MAGTSEGAACSLEPSFWFEWVSRLLLPSHDPDANYEGRDRDGTWLRSRISGPAAFRHLAALGWQ